MDNEAFISYMIGELGEKQQFQKKYKHPPAGMRRRSREIWEQSYKTQIKRYQDAIKLLKSLKKNPKSRKELLKWYKLFNEMHGDFGDHHNSRIDDEGFYGKEIMEAMYEFTDEDLKEVKI